MLGTRALRTLHREGRLVGGLSSFVQDDLEFV
jgi:hypothetical protein